MRQSKSRVAIRAGARARNRPLGEATRGTTRANRLRGVDAFVVRYAEPLLRREEGEYAGALCVDLGYGAEPTTTLEMARRLRKLNPTLPVLGVEIEPGRVEAALPFADGQTHFRLGGFNLPLRSQADGRPEQVRLIRALNVLRQYDEASVLPAWETMAASLLPDGLLIEGTSDPLGRLWAVNLLRRERSVPHPAQGSQARGELRHEALVFGIRLRDGFDATLLQAVLPKNLIHHVTPGEPMGHFFALWEQCARKTIAWREFGPRQWFVAAADALKQEPRLAGWRIDTRRKWLNAGVLIVGLPADAHTSP
jgi:hypothetical protein